MFSAFYPKLVHIALESADCQLQLKNLNDLVLASEKMCHITCWTNEVLDDAED